MSDIDSLDPTKSALLVLDHQRLLVQGTMTDPEGHVTRVKTAIGTARALGMPVIYVQKAFRPGYPEVHDANMIFSAVRAGGRLLQSDPMTQIPDEIAPQESDIVVRGTRISAFEGTELALILRAAKVETLVLFGITTSGVVLSTVRQAADMDYRMFVLRDLCGDSDKEVHDFLLERILPRQAVITDSSTFVSLRT